MTKSNYHYLPITLLINLYLFIYQSEAKALTITEDQKKFYLHSIIGRQNLEDINYYDNIDNLDKYYTSDSKGTREDDIMVYNGGNIVDDIINDENDLEDVFYGAGDDNWLESYSDIDKENYADDDITLNNRVKQKIIIYKNIAEEKFWEIYNNPPKEWTADQWGFFTSLMTLLSVAIYCCCIIGVIPCILKKKNETRDTSTRKILNSSTTCNKQYSSKFSDENIDPIMYSRSYDSQVV